MIRLYSHGGSGNHGCEALVRSTAKILHGIFPMESAPILYSYAIFEDQKYIPDTTFGNIINLNYRRGSLPYYVAAMKYRFGNHDAITELRHKKFFSDVEKDDICFCMGGDTYTYDGWPELLAYVNKVIRRKGAKTVLWGCSLSDDLFRSESFINDMRSFDLITVRERITQRMLADAGITKNVVLVSDPAFELDAEEYDIMKHFDNGKDIIGINLSPLIMSCESKNNIVLENYRMLINHIIETTDYNVALIPHVVWGGNDDRKAIRILTDEFKSFRIVTIPDMDCCSIKGAIAKCRMFIGARTHSTIAAYSQGVPTLVVGYSVKAKGIAETLFGTYENYVLPVQNLQSEQDLTEAFGWLASNEYKIRECLSDIMPKYRANCYAAASALKSII